MVRSPRQRCCFPQGLQLDAEFPLHIIAALLLSRIEIAQLLCTVVSLLRQQSKLQLRARHKTRAKTARNQVHMTRDRLTY